MKVVAIHVAPATRLPARAVEDLEYAFDCGVNRRNITVTPARSPPSRAGSACRVLTSGPIRMGDTVEVSSPIP